MIVWLRIAPSGGAPARQIYRDARALPHLAAGEARHELLIGTGELRAETGAQTSSIVVTLNNSAGACTALFAFPPLAATAELVGVVDGEPQTLFAGAILSVDLSANSLIEIAA